jgi:hypothetical protein
MLRDAEVVYSFENSSIVTEAILSGTPACFVPNEFLHEIIAEIELGSNGVAKEPTVEAIKNARETVAAGRAAYFNSVNRFQDSLSIFIEKSQFFSKTNGYNQKISIPTFHTGVNLTSHRISLARQIFKTKGLRATLRTIYHFIARRLSWRFWNKL